MIKIENKKLLSFILLFSIFALVAAYFIQYVLGHQPCNLCLIQRIPYILSIIIIALILVFQKYEKIYLIITFITFFDAFMYLIQGYFFIQ